MKSKHQLFFVIFLICILFFSCVQPNNEIPVQEYSTPTIKGTVSIPEGKNVNPGDIYVKVIDSTGATAKVQKANSDKTFVVQGLNTEMSYSILFSSVEPEFTNRAISRDPDKSNGVGGWIHDVKPAIKEGNDIGSVKLKPLGTIRGKALIDGQSEHYDTTVYIPGTSYISMTNADGTFAIYNVPEGTYTLRYTHDGYMPIMTEGVILTCPEDAENPETTTRDVKLVSSSGTVEGVALYDGLTSHSGITIKLESEDRTKAAQASTSEDGSYVFNDVAPGVYRVIVSASGYVSMSSGYFTVESATLTSVPERIVLYRNVGSVKGTVKLSDSQTDSSGIVVSFVSSDDSFTAVTDKDGYFSRILKPGSYTVTASYPGYTSQSLDVTVTENALTEINLPSLPLASGAVAGFVVLSGSEDFSGVVITLTNSTAMTESYTAVTAADGSFRFTGLNKGGTYLLTYSKDGYVSDNSKSIDVTVGSVANAGSVTLKSTFATVKGTIQLEGASSYENVTILLKNDNNQYTSTTDQNGGYVINRILPGTYTLLASKDGFVTGQITEIVIEPSSDKQADLLSLSVAIKSVTGSVELELATDHAGVLVTATNLSDNKLIYSAITNSSGNFTLAGMKAGEYSVVLSCTGYNTIMLPTINVVDTTVFTLPKQNLSISRGKISGLVKIEGYSDYSGVRVSLLGTDYSSVTEKDGSFVLEVPSGNYPGGLRYEFTDYETSSYPSTIPVLTNSTYAVPDKTLKGVNVPYVSGKVSIYGVTDGHYENIVVRIAELPEFSYTTESDGTWFFEHVPVGTYTLEIERENARKVTKIVDFKASPSIIVEDIELIPDSVTLTGNVSLDSVEDYSGVTVRITTPGSIELRTVTNAAGYFYISNIVASKSHTIYFEKEGWDTQSFDIDADKYAPLSIVDYTSEQPVTLKDTTAPDLTGMTVTIGKATKSGREIGIYLYGSDTGSGIKYIQGNTENSFEGVGKNTFYNPYVLIIPDQLGPCTIYVRVEDSAGNISDIISENIILTNDKIELYGPLIGDKLHLTKENSPYIIKDNVLVEKETELVIDPGVEIQVDGDYYIQVEGIITAVGTEKDRIKIYGTDTASNGWNKIVVPFDNGSVLSYVDIVGYRNGISGYCDIDHSNLFSQVYALGIEKMKDEPGNNYGNAYDATKVFWGDIIDSNIDGSIYAREGSLLRNTVNGDEIWLYSTQFVMDNHLNGSIYMESVNLDGNTISGSELSTKYVFALNNYVSSQTVKSYMDIQRFMTFEGCNLTLEMQTSIESSILKYCTFSKYEASDLNNSNIIECGTITIDMSREEYPKYNATGNYWGKLNAIELDAKGNHENLSFIFDYYDDMEKSQIIYDKWKKSPNENVGYQGEGFLRENLTSKEYSIGDRGPAGGYVFYDKGFYSDGWRYLEAAPSDIGEYAYGYYRPYNKVNNKMVGTAQPIGSGLYNTERLVEYMDIDGKAYSNESGEATYSEYAAKKCLDYSYGGCDDWFLPSMDELGEIYKALRCPGGTDHGGRCPDMSHAATSTEETRNSFNFVYWSSSEYSSSDTKLRFFSSGVQGLYSRDRDYVYVRAVRAF